MHIFDLEFFKIFFIDCSDIINLSLKDYNILSLTCQQARHYVRTYIHKPLVIVPFRIKNFDGYEYKICITKVTDFMRIDFYYCRFCDTTYDMIHTSSEQRLYRDRQYMLREQRQNRERQAYARRFSRRKLPMSGLQRKEIPPPSLHFIECKHTQDMKVLCCQKCYAKNNLKKKRAKCPLGCDNVTRVLVKVIVPETGIRYYSENNFYEQCKLTFVTKK